MLYLHNIMKFWSKNIPEVHFFPNFLDVLKQKIFEIIFLNYQPGLALNEHLSDGAKSNKMFCLYQNLSKMVKDQQSC